MTKLINMGLYKLRHSVEFRVIVALVLALSLALSFLVVANKGTWQKNFASALKDSFLAELFICIFSGLFIGNDFTGKTINLEITSGHTRRNILLSKAFSFLIGIAIIITIFPVVLVIVSLVSQDFQELFLFNDLIYMFKVLSFNFIVYLKTAGLLLFLCFIFKHGGKIISASILALVFKSILINSLADKLKIIGFFNRYFGPGQLDLLLNDEPAINIFKVIAFSLFIFFAFISITYLIFEKSELR